MTKKEAPIYAVMHQSRKRLRQRWYFTVHSAGNRKVIATSEMYVNKEDAVETARLITPDVRGG